ncbi:MAG: hypothetical protein HY855_08085 [Burkholderiales bacterium]|nr:hypothetical protein [Burkholderiales bacterium]
MAPRRGRFALFRSMVDCEADPDRRLTLKIADSVEELEACFRILHDAYVGAGFMRPDPSGLRVTHYHALPTTTTLCAKFDGQVVGTLSIVREGAFGFPMRSAFDLSAVRAKGGKIAEISALAIHPDFRATGGRILFPLMKFMFEYCTGHFDTRHLVIAVNPRHIEMYESLLLFERLPGEPVPHYAFVNGAPAVGATLDLHTAPARFERVYGHRPGHRNLYQYFVHTRLPNIQHAPRRYFTTNHPVMTAQLLDHFFNRRTQLFAGLDTEQVQTLRAIYHHEAYATVLPLLPDPRPDGTERRRQPRYSVSCPAALQLAGETGDGASYPLDITELSHDEFRASCSRPLPPGATGRITVALGSQVHSVVEATVLPNRPNDLSSYRFRLKSGDPAWRDCVNALGRSQTYRDLSSA